MNAGPLNSYDGPPGPQGWGEEFQTVTQKLDTERRVYDELAEVVPERLYARDPKPVNLDLLAKVKDAQRADGIDDGFCFLHLAQAIFGEKLPWLRQLIGSCVASGDMRTTAYRMLTEVFLLNDPEQLVGVDIDGRDSLAFFAPYNYRAGRKIGGLNRGDGSFCSAHIKGKMQYGHLPCSVSSLSSDAFPEPQSTSLYRQWGNSNSLLEQFASEGKKRPLVESVQVRSADEAKELIQRHNKPLNICSSWGFAADYKHRSWQLADGSAVYIYRRSGSWAHNMSCVGFVEVGNDEFVIIENSWGNYHKNGTWFAIPASLFGSWLRSAECMSVGEIDLSDNPPAWPDRE